jgi:predicted Zn-dependent peptidase
MIKRDVLPNGVRVITETVPYVQSVSIGIWVTTGSRDELTDNMGISHFIEHMLFKGTEKRSAKQIADEFDSIGGQVNAFTDKEYTCYYSKILSDHLNISLDVLSDMFLNSQFDPKEISLEKNVILEEIKRHEDTPDDQIHDLLVQKIWKDHTLGNPIIGTTDTVSAINQSSIKEYMNIKYSPDSIVVAAAGNLVHEDVVKQINDLFGHLEGRKEGLDTSVPQFAYESENFNKDTEQVHFCIATPGYSQIDDRKYPLAVLDTVLGGGMSSRLFQEIREKRGLAYAIGSYTSSYFEGGYFAVYCGTSIENIEKASDIIRSEFVNIVKNNITDEELIRAKNQLRGSMVLSQENMSNRMIRIAKSEIFYKRIMLLDELIDAVIAVTHEDVASIAESIWSNAELPMVAIGPFDGKVS